MLYLCRYALELLFVATSRRLAAAGRYDSNKYDKKTPFTVFKPENKSFGRDYLFELFEPKEQYQYENK